MFAFLFQGQKGSSRSNQLRHEAGIKAIHTGLCLEKFHQGTLGYTCALLCSGLRLDDKVTETSCFSTPFLVQALETDWAADEGNRSRDARGKICTEESLLEARLYKD